MNNNKGFTLVELLSVIVVLTLIMSVVIFVAVKTIDNAKEKSYKVTINNVQNVTSSYLLENSDRLFYVSKDDDDKLEYQCVTVKDLVENGYFKDDVYDSLVKKDRYVEDDDYVYIERYVDSKAVSKVKYLFDEDFTMCDNAVKATSDISIIVSPEGWSNNKDINIRYRVKNYFNINDYTYEYKYSKDDVLSVISDGGNEKKLNVIDNGTIDAWIYEKNDVYVGDIKSKVIDKIDRVGPRLELDKYTGNNYVGNSVVIPLNVIDYGIGVDIDTFTVEDLVVTIGDKVITDGIKLNKVSQSYNNNSDIVKYNLEINNSVDIGLIKISIDDNKFFDKLENPNEKVEIDTGILINQKYTINYLPNGGTGKMDSQVVLYNSDVTIASNKFKRDGYKFLGWTTRSDGEDDGYKWTNWSGKWNYINGKNGVKDGTLTLYARWEVNKVIIKFHVNGGTITNTTSDDKYTYNWSTTDSLIYKDDKVYTKSVKFDGTSTIDLPNYNNSEFIEIKRTGYTAVKDSEWICISGCSVDNKKFDQYISPEYKASDFCNIDNGSCTVVLKVNWKANSYNLSYDLRFKNAVKGSKTPSSATYNKNFYLDNPNYENYTFKGWTFDGNTTYGRYGSTSDDVTNKWSSRSTKVTDKYFKNLSIQNGSTIKLTANWEVNLVERIKYLYNKNASGNYLKKDNNGNIRFYGDNPNNYVEFNGELWRIIGVFNVSDGNSSSQRIKLIRVDSLVSASYDSSPSDINGGCGINNWPTSTLKAALNDYYAGDSSDCTYDVEVPGTFVYYHKCQTTTKKCSSNFSKLGTEARKMIDKAKWYLGGIEMGGDADGDNFIGAEEAYMDEHGDRTGRHCSAIGTNGNCTDTEPRDHTWIGKVGLISPSDYGFASSDISCYQDDITYNYSCGNNNWLAYGGDYWTLNPRDSNWFANAIWRVYGKRTKDSSSVLGDPVAALSYDVRPSVYLKNKVSTTLGIGSKSDPYILTIS